MSTTETRDTAALLVAELESGPACHVDSGRVDLPESLYNRVLALLKRPLVEWVNEYNASEQSNLPVVIRDETLEFLAALGEEHLAELSDEHQLEKFEIRKLRFTTDSWDNGYFFIDTPDLVLDKSGGGELVIAWTDVFGDTYGDTFKSPDLEDYTSDLTDAFGPVGSGTTLDLDMAAGTAEIVYL